MTPKPSDEDIWRCACEGCALLKHLKKRLKLLSNIEPLDTRAREVRWHRINELEQALDVMPRTPHPDEISLR